MANKDTTLDRDVLRVALNRNFYARIARRLGVHRSHVRRVARGEKRSNRVMCAIKSELRRIEKELARMAA